MSAKKYNFGIKLTLGLLMVMAVSLGVFVLTEHSKIQAQVVAFSSARDCDPPGQVNSILNCGALTISELQTKYNQSHAAQVVYSYFGISSQDIASLSSTAVAGQVNKAGDVYVHGTVVATGALTAGFENITGSTPHTLNGVTFYTRTPSVSFVSGPLDAFVVTSGSRVFAIVASCGNPVIATALKAPATTPSPTPSPTTPQTPPSTPQSPPSVPPSTPPVTTTTATPKVTSQPTALANTGAGSTAVLLFAGTAIVGTGIHRFYRKYLSLK